LYEGAVDGEDGWGAEVNDNFRRLDLLVAPRVTAIGTDTPPGSPADGDAYVVGGAPTGAWSTHTNKIARWNAAGGGVWEFITAREGWRVYDLATSRVSKFTGSSWVGGEVFDAYAYALGSPAAGQIMLAVPLVRAVTFPINLAGSHGTAQVAATNSAVFNIKKNGTTVASATFASAATVATFTTVGGVAVNFAAGDVLSIVAPTPTDATLDSVGFGITGIR
jgi:hypothetical protein